MAALAVSVGGVRAGLLHRNGEGSSFALGEEYLTMPDRPILGQTFEDDPDRTRRTRQGVPSWFANLLPEGPLRHLIAERAGVNERRSLFLLGLLGDDLPGAVTVKPTTDDLGSEEIADRPIDADAPIRFSLAGVQLKFSAMRRDRGLTIPAEGRGGNWIVKLPDERYDGVPENEYATMELARLSGIDVPKTELVDIREIEGLPQQAASVEGRAFAVKRFDRDGKDGRVHIEDFAQVLGLSPEEKYGATNYDTIARVIASVCTEEDVDEFVRRLVFTIAVGNSDAHAKNWSLIYPDGRTARLAPAYDLVAVSLYESIDRRLSPRLALRLAGARSADEATEATFRRLAERADLDLERTIDIVKGQVQTINASWEQLRETSNDWLNPRLKKTLDERLVRLPLFK